MEWSTVVLVGLGFAAAVAMGFLGFGEHVATVFAFVGGLVVPSPKIKR